jgi:4-amino-4-deoxy-L-arabinose transferase-like glycosyltransferase
LVVRAKTYEETRIRFLSIWFVAAFVFFSAVPNKLPLYVLPLMPALAIILAVAVDKTPGREWWLAGSMLLLVLMPSISAALPVGLLGGAMKAHWSFSAAGLPIIAVATVVWWLARRGLLAEAMVTCAAAVALGVGYLKLRTLPLLEQRDSVREFSRAHQLQLTDACVDPHVSRAWAYGLEYYGDRGLPECGSAPASWHIHASDGVLVVEPGS